MADWAETRYANESSLDSWSENYTITVAADGSKSLSGGGLGTSTANGQRGGTSNNNYTSHSSTTTEDYSRTDDYDSGSGSSYSDSFNHSGGWTSTPNSDGTLSTTSHGSNQMTGSNVGSWNDSWSWSETYYGSGSGSGSGSTSSDSGSSSGTFDESYSQTGDEPGYYSGAYSSDNSSFDGHYGGVGTGYGSGGSSSGIESIIANIYSGIGSSYGSGSDHAIDTGSDSEDESGDPGLDNKSEDNTFLINYSPDDMDGEPINPNDPVEDNPNTVPPAEGDPEEKKLTWEEFLKELEKNPVPEPAAAQPVPAKSFLQRGELCADCHPDKEYPTLSGEYPLAFLGYNGPLSGNETEPPVPDYYGPFDPLTEAFLEGFIEGLADEAQGFVKGIVDLFTTWPWETVANAYDGIVGLKNTILNEGLLDALREVDPDFFELIDKWDNISDAHAGILVGRVVAKYGSLAVGGAGTVKFVKKLREVSKELLRKKNLAKLDGGGDVPTKPPSKSDGGIAKKLDNCFPADTLVSTAEGLLPIQSIQADDRVWAFDHVADEWKLCRVIETFTHEHVGNLIAATVGGEMIESTSHHPWWVVQGEGLTIRPRPEHVPDNPDGYDDTGRWVDAIDLRVGDVLLLRSGEQVPITALIVRHARLPVYNFHVEELHCYAVGSVQILVHNNSELIKRWTDEQQRVYRVAEEMKKKGKPAMEIQTYTRSALQRAEMRMKRAFDGQPDTLDHWPDPEGIFVD